MISEFVNESFSPVSYGGGIQNIKQIDELGIDGDYVELHFIAKTTDNANYAEAINVTMAKVDDNTQSYTHPVGKVRAHPTQYISNVPLEDFDNNVYLKVEFNSNVDPTKIAVDIYKNGTVTGTVDLDANGQATVTDYVNSSTDTYKFDFNNHKGQSLYIRDNFNGWNIHIKKNGSEMAVNETEKENDPLVQKEADIRHRWPAYHPDKMHLCDDHATILWEMIPNEYKDKWRKTLNL
mgnify:CR=1 FL=1